MLLALLRLALSLSQQYTTQAVSAFMRVAASVSIFPRPTVSTGIVDKRRCCCCFCWVWWLCEILQREHLRLSLIHWNSQSSLRRNRATRAGNGYGFCVKAEHGHMLIRKGPLLFEGILNSQSKLRTGPVQFNR